jgi:hypothetical protein
MGESNFDFDSFRSFVKNFELFAKDKGFKLLKINIGVFEDFQLVMGAIIKKIDNELIWVCLIKGKAQAGFLNGSITDGILIWHLHG